jgi:peptidyl-prolyl cis-trans isomerase SurA
MFSIMRRIIAVGMLGLVLAGCAQPRSSAPGAASRGQPIGMEPMPALSDTINRGTGDPALVQATLPDPKSQNWSGQFAPLPRGPAGTPPVGQQAAGPKVVRGPAPAGELAGSAPASAVLASPSSPPIDSAGRVAGDAGMSAAGADAREARAPTAQPAQPIPSQRPGMAEPETGRSPGERAPSAATAGSPLPEGTLPPVEEPRAFASPGAPLEDAKAAPPAARPAPVPTPVPAATAGAPHGPAAVADQLLGPNPDLMPAIDASPPAAVKDGKRPAAGPAAKSVPSAPGTASAPGDLPLETAPELPVDPQPASGSLSPARPAAPAPTTPNGQAGSPSASTASPTDGRSAQTAALQPAPRSDSPVRLASYDPLSFTDLAIDRNWKEAGRAAARVGNEVITLHDLVLNVKEQLRRHPPGRDLTRQELNMAAKNVLAGLIERTLIAQEAKRVLKNPKQLDRLYEAADKYWREEELPPLMRHYLADNEFQLKQKFTESGRSLETLHQTYRQEFLAQVYMDQKLADRRKVELPEMLKYYNDHLHDKEYDRPAQITWRELVVEKGHYPNPADAHRKADNFVARLNRGEDFATLARNESEGPTSVRAQGGLMQTSPGSYAVEAVNQALESLPLNQVSPVLEGPTSLHIVRVENRRAAGPASFEEVQDQIRRKVMSDKMHKARDVFIARLKRDALISTIFDGTESDPSMPEER